MKDFSWLNNKTPRAVDQLRLWPENPRLNPEETHIYLSDYANDLTSDRDRSYFFDLVKSIIEDGFIPADPIVVWQNDSNGKFYVAEGNRRVLALKLLRDPLKSPQSIRGFMIKQSQKINKKDIEKILVNVAPTFDDAEWYINQRNNASSLQLPWSRIQQQRWIAELYDKYEGDIEKIKTVTKMSQGELEGFIRILKIKDLVNEKEVKENLTEEEFEKASSHKFPITILERFFSIAEVKEKWGIDNLGIDINIKSNRRSFLNAYTALIKKIIDKDADIKIDTRTITSNLSEILESLPTVSFEEEEESSQDEDSSAENSLPEAQNANNNNQSSADALNAYYQNLKNDPNRQKLVLPIYKLNTDSFRLKGLFDDFKKIPYTYINCVAAALRVFLDLAVFKFIETENIEANLRAVYKTSLREIPLSKRLEYIKQNNLTGKPQTIVSRLLDPATQYSLDVLNGYVHSQDTHYLTKQFLNSFWDFLFPLFQVLLDIKEENV